MRLSYQEITDLAIFVAIDLDNLRRGKIKDFNFEAVEKLKQWFTDAVEIYGRQENFCSAEFDPTTAVALNDLLADFFRQPQCRQLSELSTMIAKGAELFDFAKMEEIIRLKKFCLAISDKFLRLW